MKTLTTAIQNSFDVPRIVKYEVTDARENDTDETPSLVLSVRLYGPGGIQYGNDVTLTAYDSVPSICLEKNPAQQGYGDMFRLVGKVVSGAYTTLSGAYNGNIANPTKRKRCLAMEGLLPTTLLSADFAS